MGRTRRMSPDAEMSEAPATAQPAWSVDPQDLVGNDAVQQAMRGRGVCTPYGDFEVVPDDQGMCAVPTVAGTEVITESELAAGAATWDHVEAQDGSLAIDPADRAGDVHPGFNDEARGHLSRLMQTRGGRQLVQESVDSPLPITIVPSARGSHPGTLANIDALRQPDGTPGAGSPAFVQLPEDLQPQVAMRPDGTHYDTPPDVVVGHELGHANRDTRGLNRRFDAPVEGAFDTREEEEVIRTGPGVTEDQLLAERNLGPRFGHGLSSDPE